MKYCKSYENIFQTNNNLTTIGSEVSTTLIANNVQGTNTTSTYDEILPEVIEGNTVGIEATSTIQKSYD